MGFESFKKVCPWNGSFPYGFEERINDVCRALNGGSPSEMNRLNASVTRGYSHKCTEDNCAVFLMLKNLLGVSGEERKI